MQKRISRITIYTIAICVFLLVVNITLGLVLINQSDKAMRTLIENRMLDVANTAAAMLDGDALATLQADDVDAPAYQETLRILRKYLDNIDLEYIYCVRDMSNKQFVFMIDPDVDPGQFGEPIEFTDALYSASLGTPAVDKEPYEDRWGRFYSAYTPVFTSDHQIGGIVAVDFSADWYENQVAGQIRTTLLVSALSLLLAALVVVAVTTRFRNHFKTMLKEMNSLSGGIETLVQEVSPGAAESLKTESSVPATNDEITELSSRIRSLEDQLSERIQFVRSQAFIDGLTGLANRSAYEEHVKRLDDEIKEGKADFTLALFDLNGLKELNDRQGHEAGDRAIIRVADALTKVFDDSKVYRIGGDEFVAILEPTARDMDYRFMVIDGMLEDTDTVAVAKGCTSYEAGTDDGYRMVFGRADLAMYNDKKRYYETHQDRRRR